MKNIRKAIWELEINDELDIYYLYDYNPSYSAPVLIGQWYSIEPAMEICVTSAYYAIFKYDSQGELQCIYPSTAPKLSSDIILQTYDSWADNSQVIKTTKVSKVLPVTPDDTDGYFVVKDMNEKLGLIKLALR